MVNARECITESTKVLTSLQQSVHQEAFGFPKDGLKGVKGLLLLNSKKGALGLGYETGNGIAINVGYNDDGSMYTSGPVPLKLSKLTVGVQLGFSNIYTLVAAHHYNQMEKLLSSGRDFIMGKDINIMMYDYQHASKAAIQHAAGRGNDDILVPGDPVKVVSVSDSLMFVDFSLYGGSLGVDTELLAEMYSKDTTAMDVLSGRTTTPEPLKGYMDDLLTQLTRLASL
ncbi:hypothetical protein HYH03_010127 [Edaphochlamys debaryana]|uniref:Ysc84 actin-binding domain-containing protein n=1 Tax=Edaphochlamys debaryana TaxID=47281 RepID=A0A835XYW2_9CHLO|nr:hypothetical protein HYH03_010127 [Edaphochlamys debaryana]|eukprot:KAG2491558.1 hypothetical protein HYH03_010127 [Edaphochlamys debaryana]